MKAEPRSSLRVRDILTPNPICVTADTSARELGRILDVNEITGAPVIDGSDRVIGVVSKSDLLHRCVSQLLDDDAETLWENETHGRPWDPYELGVVSDFMTSEPVTATVDESIADVARRLAERRIHRAIVIDELGTAIGVITTLDMMKAIGEKPKRRAVPRRTPAITTLVRNKPRAGVS